MKCENSHYPQFCLLSQYRITELEGEVERYKVDLQQQDIEILKLKRKVSMLCVCVFVCVVVLLGRVVSIPRFPFIVLSHVGFEVAIFLSVQYF